MRSAMMVLVALLALAPAVALAHGPNEHAADPNLHVGDKFSECWVEFSPGLTQEAFRQFVREFGSVSAFKSVSSSATLGKRGFSLGIEQQNFTVAELDPQWNDTFVHPDSYHELGADKSFPLLRARYGITDRVDVGAFYTKSPNANYGWLGFEAKYGVLRQAESMPVSLALRGAYTQTLYVSDMDMRTLTSDVSVGRTFWGVVTPYVGLGGNYVIASETTDAVDLHSENQFVPHSVAGLELRWWHVGLGAEATWGELNVLQFQVSARF